MFVNLRGHSTYSLLEAIGSIDKIIKRVKKLGMDSVCLTEYYVFSGAVEFYQKSQKNNIKPIIGTEIGFLSDVKYVAQQRFVGNIVLIAKNKTGYYNLLKIISKGNSYKKDGKPCIDFEILNEHKDGIYTLIGGEKSVFGQMLLQNENEKKLTDFVLEIKNIVGQENFFMDLMVQDYSLVPKMKKINEEVLNFCQIHSVKTLINNNFHYVNKGDKKYFETALAIKDGNKIYDENRRKVVGDYHIMSEKEIFEIMQKNGFEENFLQDLMKNNLEVSESINTEIDLYQPLFPIHQTPSNIEELYNQNKDILVEK